MTLDPTPALLQAAGPMSGRNVIGETTESIHKFLLDGYTLSEQPPRVEEDLKFVPKDREEVIYLYMYRLAQNPNLQNRKRLRTAPIFIQGADGKAEPYYHRPPLLLDLFYLITVHSKFRSDAERLMGWLMLRLNEATHLIYRPRRFLLPDGREVDSLGRPWDPTNFSEPEQPNTDEEDETLHVEKVSLAMVDDLTVGDAINFFTLHEAPYRPFLTYRARIALDGPLYKSEGGVTVRMPPLKQTKAPPPPAGAETSRNGRVRPGYPTQAPKVPPGPKPYFVRKTTDPDQESED